MLYKMSRVKKNKNKNNMSRVIPKRQNLMNLALIKVQIVRVLLHTFKVSNINTKKKYMNE